MAFTAFLKVEGIEGDAQNDKHRSEIVVLDYDWLITQPKTDPGYDGSQTGGRAEFKALTVIKQLDKASPNMALYCAKGSHIPKVTLSLCRDIGDQQTYMEYILTDAIITSVNPHTVNENINGDGKAEKLPRERVSFAYNQIEWRYTPTDNKGRAGSPVSTGWSVGENKRV